MDETGNTSKENMDSMDSKKRFNLVKELEKIKKGRWPEVGIDSLIDKLKSKHLLILEDEDIISFRDKKRNNYLIVSDRKHIQEQLKKVMEGLNEESKTAETQESEEAAGKEATD